MIMQLLGFILKGIAFCVMWLGKLMDGVFRNIGFFFGEVEKDLNKQKNIKKFNVRLKKYHKLNDEI